MVSFQSELQEVTPEAALFRLSRTDGDKQKLLLKAS